MIQKESERNNSSSNQVESLYVKQVLEVGENQRKLNKDNYYFQIGLLSATGILDKLSQWQNYKEDAQLLVSKESDGRVVLNLRWNFRDFEGKSICDEVGAAYITGSRSRLARVHEEEVVGSGFNSEIFTYKTSYFEYADFILVWGAKPVLVRHFSHGKVKKVMQELAKFTDSLDDGETYNVIAVQEAWNYTPYTDFPVALGLVSGFEKDVLQELEVKRLESGKELSRLLTNAILKPRIRVNPKNNFQTPLTGDNGFNGTSLLERLEEKVSLHALRTRKNIEDNDKRILRLADQAANKKDVGKLASLAHEPDGDFLAEEEEMAAAMMEEADYSPEPDHESCSLNEESGMYSGFEMDGHYHYSD